MTIPFCSVRCDCAPGEQGVCRIQETSEVAHFESDAILPEMVDDRSERVARSSTVVRWPACSGGHRRTIAGHLIVIGRVRLGRWNDPDDDSVVAEREPLTFPMT